MAFDDAALTEVYEHIKRQQPAQQRVYDAWLPSQDCSGLVATAASLGLKLDVAGGQVAYADDFPAKRLPLCFDLIYCRHGKTTGNTEPRVYQGFVDEPQNALNEIGLGQAEDAADLMMELGVKPDLIVLSPLSRAAQTGEAFVRRREAELRPLVELWEDTAEMRFGAWDNQMVKDLAADNICHLFYLAQNAMVKTEEPYREPSTGAEYGAENFVEVLARMHGVLCKLNAKVEPLVKASRSPGRTARSHRPVVLMYGHSMAGAALAILTGNGKQVDGEEYLGFDGKYIMPNATPVYLNKQ